MTSSNDPVTLIEHQLAPLREQIQQHPIASHIKERSHLLCFMKYHVFSVWDFGCVVRSLHQVIHGDRGPFLPPKDPASVRLLADTRPITTLLRVLSQKVPIQEALKQISMPEAALHFVQHTLHVIQQSPQHIAAHFVFGREFIIPALFHPLWTYLKQQAWPETQMVMDYLKRHIDLDGQGHYPKGIEMLRNLCGDQSARWAIVAQEAQRSLEARITWLDRIDQAIEGIKAVSR